MRIRVQAFVFLLSVHEKKLVLAKIKVLSGKVHILRDVMLHKTLNQRELSTAFVK